MDYKDDSIILAEVHYTIEVEILRYKRSEVLTKLMEYAAQAARVFGPFSDEACELQDDIEDVRDGADLIDFLWVFPEADKFNLEGNA